MALLDSSRSIKRSPDDGPPHGTAFRVHPAHFRSPPRFSSMQVIELLEAGISSLDLLFVLTALGLGSMLTYVTAGSLAERHSPGTWGDELRNLLV